MSEQVSLTPKQAVLLRFIAGYRFEHGTGPTVRQGMEAAGYQSTGAVSYALRKLKRLGLLLGESGVSGTLSAGKHCATCTCGGDHGGD